MLDYNESQVDLGVICFDYGNTKYITSFKGVMEENVVPFINH